PIGAIITPQFMGVTHEPALPFASSLCGACGEVCPVKIDIPKVLLDLRSDVKKTEAREKQNRLERLAYKVFAWVMTHPRIYEFAGRLAASVAPSGDGGWIRSVPTPMNVSPVRAWLSERDLPPPPSKSFREMWRRRQMSRQTILHKWRTALGRRAGQPPSLPPPVRLRVPTVDTESRIATMTMRIEALAGKTWRVGSAREACALASQFVEGKAAVASNAPYLAECGI